MNPIFTSTAEPGSAKPAIYSPRVVLVFSMLFSALAGGILTFYSLRDAGQPAAARRAFFASLAYVAGIIVLFALLPSRGSGVGISVGLGYAGGYVLNQFFLKKYLPDEEAYPRKSWVKPLLIWVVVLAALLGVFVQLLVVSGAAN